VGKWFVENHRGELELKKYTNFYHQVRKAKAHNKTLPDEIIYPNYQSPSEVVWSSKPINTKQIVTLLQNPTQQQQALELELKKLAKEIGKSFTDEQKELVSEFIQNQKKLVENKKDKEVKNKVREVEEKLETEGFANEEIEKIIEYCKKIVKLVNQLDKEQLQPQIEIPTNK